MKILQTFLLSFIFLANLALAQMIKVFSRPGFHYSFNSSQYKELIGSLIDEANKEVNKNELTQEQHFLDNQFELTSIIYGISIRTEFKLGPIFSTFIENGFKIGFKK